MNKILAMLGCFIFVLGLAGCGQQNEKMSGQPQLGGETGENVFPESMVGVWEVKTGQYKDKWGFKFEPDGSILKIIYAAEGPVYLAEGESYGEAQSEDAYYFFTMGPCEARYRPETRMLKVKIVMEYMIKLSFGELEGGMEDYFEGPVSEDGKMWKTEWLHYRWLEEEATPDPNVIKAHSIPLAFTKIDIK